MQAMPRVSAEYQELNVKKNHFLLLLKDQNCWCSFIDRDILV